MKLRPSTRAQKFGASFGLFLLVVTLWWLVASISEAAAFGTVTLRYGEVPWRHAWVFFAGLILVAIAGVSFVSAALVNDRYVFLGVSTLCLGWLLLALSTLLSSLFGTALLFGMITLLIATFFLNRYLGKLEAGVFYTVVFLGFFFLLLTGRFSNGA